MSAFDLCGPLPTGTTLLEASAGTGKTYAIAALVARYVAEGVPLEKILVVTFTRPARAELSERIRARLVETEAALARDVPPAEPVAALLATGARDEVELRRKRLAKAIAEYDAATIATTHGFCEEVLAGLGVAGPVERDATFVEDPADLVAEVVDDLYVRRFFAYDPAFERSEALKIATLAVENPVAPLHPTPQRGSSDVPVMRATMAEVAREELDRRKRLGSLMTYSDQLTLLREELADPVRGPLAAARLQADYSVVLVDEFQDTDPLQWEIVDRAFGSSPTALVLIGDPKQAIYAFRGGDVFAYLAAAQAAGTRASLDVNWRSDQGLIDALDALFGHAQLGHPGIAYREVHATTANKRPRLHGAPQDAPLRVRLCKRDGATTPKGYARVATARERIATDLAADVAALLASGARIDVRAEDGTTTGSDPVTASDVAVLVRTHFSAELVRDALGDAGVPAVINGAGSVFATEPARYWLRLLEALERPSNGPRARAAALTPFLGWSADEVARAGDDQWEDVFRRLHRWARVLRVNGVASLAETITLTESLPARVLELEDGERTLTDLRHVAQLLHATATDEALGVTALTQWLRRRIEAAARETGFEERSRRLESDARAVQILTIHASKGLEFPIVHLPFLWDASTPRDGGRPVFFHDPEDENRRAIDVGIDGAPSIANQRRQRHEELGEELRLAYVALTRARHQAVVWWAGSFGSKASALTRLLFATAQDGSVADEGPVPTDSVVGHKLVELRDRAPDGCIALERAVPAEGAAYRGEEESSGALEAARFARTLDARWRRTSYSDITAERHDAAVGSEPEEPLLDDEADDAGAPLAAADGDAPLAGIASPMAALPAGTRFGTLVHDVLEATEFDAPDLGAELDRTIADGLARRPMELDAGLLRDTLHGVIETPLLGDVRLRDVPRSDRLDELVFELPLVGGDRPGAATLGPVAIGALLRERLPDGDPLRPYADRLDDPLLRQGLRGYLTGSIDLALRTPDGRFAVVDYKTNRLSAPGEELTAWHYRDAAVTAEMLRAHYALQALLYCVALHRFLRWRLPGYDPDTHVAGVLYLFLRGMPDAGVFSWSPPPGLVAALSDLLDEGAT